MFTKTQIEAAAETLGTPFTYPELEALRKIALWSLRHRPVLAIPAKPRKTRRRHQHMLEKVEDVVTSNEAPRVLMQRHGYSIFTIRAIKAGYPPYQIHGGCSEFWRDYKRQHGTAITGLFRQMRT